MATSTRRIEVEILGDSSDLERAFGKSSRSAKEFNRSISQTARGALVGSGAFRSLSRSVAFASSSFLGGAGIVFALKSVIDQASTLQEETEKTGVVFGRNAEQVQGWSRTLAASFGVGTGEALKAAGTFGNMFHSLNIGQAEAARMSQRLVELAADMASFNNASPEDTLAALSSGLAGQVRPLRQFGVFLSQDRIKQEALSAGIAKNVSHLTAEQKLQAAYNIILHDTRIQQGDVARNTESLSVAMSKLKAALENTEAIIGEALLPSLTKLVNKGAEWLSQSENQERIQRDVNTAIQITTTLLAPLAAGWKLAADAVALYNDAAGKFRALPGPIQGALKKGFSNALAGVPGVGALQQLITLFPRHAPGLAPGQSPIGENALGGGGFVPGGAGARTTRGRLGLKARFSKLELALAKASLTDSDRDDKAILKLEAQNLKQQLARRKLTLKERTDLTNQLAGVEDQIQQIEDRAAQKRLDKQKKAADKAKAERKKAHDAAVKAAKEAADDAKRRIGILRDLISTERDRIGALFTGPVFDPSDAQRKAALGAPTPGSNVKTLISDLKAQIQQFKAFERDLKTLAKRGAPPQLLAELRQGGLAVAPQVHALATAGGGDFQKFKQLFIQRERLAVEAAKQERPIINLTVIVEKDSGKVTVKTTPTARSAAGTREFHRPA